MTSPIHLTVASRRGSAPWATEAAALEEPPSDAGGSLFVSEKHAAKLLGISQSTLNRRARQNSLPAGLVPIEWSDSKRTYSLEQIRGLARARGVEAA